MNNSLKTVGSGLSQIMRTPLVCASEASVQVAEQSRGSELVVPTTPESRMAKMKKKISSPLAKRKVSGPSMKTFGLPLEDLLKRNSDSDAKVPFIVSRITDFIQTCGIRSEGIFRLSGNKKEIERLKAAFDKTGDADLEESGDLMAVAVLLKLFLRELPDSPIPEEFTAKFIKVQEDYSSQKDRCIQEFRNLMESLPECNYHLVKYLMCFLVKVSIYEEVNKMNAKALAIVFGPNLFRCSDGIQGLKDQQHTNLIVCSLIENYDEIFKGEDEDSPYNTTVISVEEVRDQIFTFSPKLKGRRDAQSEMNIEEDGYFDEDDDISPYATSEFIITREREGESSPNNPATCPELVDGISDSNKQIDNPHVEIIASSSVQEPLPAIDEPIYATVNKKTKTKAVRISNGSDVSPDENTEAYIRSMSPTWSVIKNSSNGIKTATAEGKESVDHIISETVKEHLFGGGTSTDETSQESDTNQVNVCSSEDDRDGEEPPLPPRKYLTEQNYVDNIKLKRIRRKRREIQEDETDSGMKENIISENLVNKDTDEEENMEITKPLKRRPKSKAFDMFENKGLLIGMDSVHKSTPSKHSSRHEAEQDSLVGNDSSDSLGKQSGSSKSLHRDEKTVDFNMFDLNPHSSLICLTRNRAPPPKNRRKPSSRKDLSSVEGQYRNTLGLKELRVSTDGANDGPQTKSFVHPLVEEAKKQDVSAPPPMSPRSPRKAYLSSPTSPRESCELDDEDVEDIPLYKPRKGQSALSRQLRKYHQGMGIGIPPLELFKLQQEGEESEQAMPSPREKYEGLLFEEATLSPRSLRSTVEPRSHLIECPPSPPNEQIELSWHEKRQETSPTGELSVKQLTKRIHILKKKIKDWEDMYKEEHGCEASQSEKAPVMKYTAELGRAKKQLREIKDKAKDSADRLNETAPAAANSTDSLLETVPQTVEQSLERALKKLQEKRRKTKRPEEVEDMSHKQLQEEKVTVQKALLQHESVFGRPTTKRDKEVMRPLYDRYRLIKRRLTTAVVGSPPRGSREGVPIRKNTPEKATLTTDLVPILEDSMLMSPKSSPVPEKLVGKVEDQTKGSNLGDTLEDDRTLGETLDFEIEQAQGSSVENDDEREEANLHELSIEELLKQQETTKKTKKKLRVKLREFEDNFLQESGRKVQKEDRVPLDKEYHQYKQIKARLRLLEALISKRQMSKTI